MTAILQRIGEQQQQIDRWRSDMNCEYNTLYRVKLVNGSVHYFDINTMYLWFNEDSMCYEFEKSYRVVAVFPVNQILSITPVTLSADEAGFNTIKEKNDESIN